MPNTGDSKPPAHNEAAVIRTPDAAAFSAAGQKIRAGELVAFPTETVYGLGADATDGTAVARIFAAKGRPRFNPLIVHVATLAEAEKLGIFSPPALRLAAAFWPGPLTIVVERRPGTAIADLVSAGLNTLALRIPDHPVAQALLAAAQRPLAAPSANRSGHVSATSAQHVAADLGDRVSMIIDGGPTRHGLESTVVDATSDDIALLRPGAITAEALERVSGRFLRRVRADPDAPSSPGQLESHYAPTAALRLNARTVEPGEALLAFGSVLPATAGPVINLSAHGDLVEAAARLFSALRSLDAKGVKTIAVMPIPFEGLGEAINDRLTRAAAPRG